MREGQSRWVQQAVISHASFRRIRRNGKSYFTMMSLHINNTYAKQVDLVACDVNGAAWRRQSGSDPRPISIIEEAFVNTNLPRPPGPSPLWGPGGVPGEWSDVCGFLKPPVSENEWQVRMHGAFTVPYGMLGLKKADQNAITKFGSTSSTSTRDWLMAYPVKTNIVDEIRERGTHFTTTPSYDHSWLP